MHQIHLGGPGARDGRRRLFVAAAALLATGVMAACGLVANDPDPGNKEFNRVRNDPAITTEPPGVVLITAVESPRSKGYDPKQCPPGQTSCPPAQGFVVRRNYRIISDSVDGNEAIFAWYDKFLTDQGFVRNKASEEAAANRPIGAPSAKTDSHDCVAYYGRENDRSTSTNERTGVSLWSRSTAFQSSAPAVRPSRCTLVGADSEPDGTLQVGITSA